MKKKTETKANNFTNEVVLTLYAHELEEKKNCDILKCSMSTGKDKDGNYKKSAPVTVIITDKTDNTIEEDFESGFVTVNGSLAFEYNEYKGKEYLNIKIFASAITNEKK